MKPSPAIRSIRSIRPRWSAARPQKGAVLVMGLILLLVLTIVGFSSMKTTGTQQKSATNHDNKAISMQAAEYGLSVVAQKVKDGCTTAASCILKIFNASLSDENLTAVPNSARAFWALNSEITKDSATGEITAQIIGASKDNLTGTKAAISIFQAVFKIQEESTAVWSGNVFELSSKDPSKSSVIINGSLQIKTDLKIYAGTVDIDGGTYQGSLTCPYCSSNQLSLLKAGNVSSPPLASTLIPGSTNSTNCGSPNTWASNMTLICNNSVKFTNDVVKNLTNFKMLVNNSIEIDKNFQLTGTGNLIASTNDIKFLRNGSQEHAGFFHADNSIEMVNGSAASATLTGTLTARTDVKVNARVFTLNLPTGGSSGSGGSASTSAFQIKSWRQLS